MCGIYMIKNQYNDKVYIGQSKDIKHRWSTHRTELNANRHVNRHLQGAWNKYGANMFTFEILEECAQDQLDIKEKYYINLYNSYINGYNLDKGGNGVVGFKHTEDQLKKMRKASNPLSVLQFDLNFNLMSHFDSCSHAAKTLKYTKDCILRCCNHDGKMCYKDSYWVYEQEYYNENFSWSKYLNREKICHIERNTNKKHCRKIYQYTKDKNLVHVWDSFSDLEKAGFTRHAVLDICNQRKNKKTHKGFLWTYDDYDWSDGYFDNINDAYDNAIKNKMKPVIQYDISGQYITQYLSRTEAANACNIDSSCICAAIVKHTTCVGYLWADKNNDWVKQHIDNHKELYTISKCNPQPVQQIDDNGIIVNTYESISAAAKYMNCRACSIHRAITNSKKYREFYWKKQ